MKNPSRPLLMSFTASGVGIALLGAAAGHWFKHRQLQFVSESLVGLYPTSGWIAAMATGALLFFSLWLGLVAVASWLGGEAAKDRLPRVVALAALTFAGVLLAPLQLSFALWLCLALQAALLGWISTKGRRPELGRHALAFLLILGCNLCFNRFLGPVAWENPAASAFWGESGHLGANTPMFAPNFLNVKRFDVSGFPEGYWGTMPHSPVGGFSFGVAFLTWLFDPPLVDVNSFYRLTEVLCFAWAVAGSFAFYLFLLEGLGIAFLPAAIGGALFILSNFCLAQMVTQYFPIFSGPCFTIPFALWLGRTAYQRGQPARAFLAGAVFSLNFYILPSHPDPLVHALAFCAAYFFFLTIALKEQSALRRIGCFVAFLAGSFLAGARYLLPIWAREHSGEMIVFGHLDSPFLYDIVHSWDVVLSPLVLWPGFLLVVLALLRWKTSFRRAPRADLWFFVSFSVLMLFLLGLGNDTPGLPLLSRFFPSINFRFPYRVMMYLVLSLLVLVCFALESVLTSEVKLGWRDALLVASPLYMIPLMMKGRTEIADWLALFLLLVALVRWLEPKLGTKARVMGWLVTLALMGSAGKTYFSTAKYQRNSPDCAPNVTLQTLLLGYKALGFDDPPSLSYIHAKLAEFETRLAVIEHFNGTETPYSKTHRVLLDKFHLKSFGDVPLGDTISFAENVHPLLDAFDLEQGCTYEPMYPIAGRPELPGFPELNNTSLLSGIENPAIHRVLVAAGFHHFIGAWAPGFLIHNRTVAADTRFNRLYPPLQAIYLVPGETFQCVGNYICPLAWAFDASVLINPASRKVFEVAGIDDYVFNRKQFEQVQDKTDLQVLPFSMHPTVAPPYAVVADQRSYGIAYLASKAHVIPSEAGWEKFMPPLGALPEMVQAEYNDRVARMRNAILALKEKHEAYLEDDSRVGKDLVANPESRLQIEKIYGNKALFKVHCAAEPCLAVLNDASESGWRAFIDESPAPVERVNFAFLGVEVPRGDHVVWLEFYDEVELWGTFLTLGAFFFALALHLKGKARA